MPPDGSFKIPCVIFFSNSITFPPLAFVGSIKSLIDCITLFLSILLAFEIVEAMRSISWNWFKLSKFWEFVDMFGLFIDVWFTSAVCSPLLIGWLVFVTIFDAILFESMVELLLLLLLYHFN